MGLPIWYQPRSSHGAWIGESCRRLILVVWMHGSATQVHGLGPGLWMKQYRPCRWQLLPSSAVQQAALLQRLQIKQMALSTLAAPIVSVALIVACGLLSSLCVPTSQPSPWCHCPHRRLWLLCWSSSSFTHLPAAAATPPTITSTTSLHQHPHHDNYDHHDHHRNVVLLLLLLIFIIITMS